MYKKKINKYFPIVRKKIVEKKNVDDNISYFDKNKLNNNFLYNNCNIIDEISLKNYDLKILKNNWDDFIKLDDKIKWNFFGNLLYPKVCEILHEIYKNDIYAIPITSMMIDKNIFSDNEIYDNITIYFYERIDEALEIIINCDDKVLFDNFNINKLKIHI